jgi:hypothetical protein
MKALMWSVATVDVITAYHLISEAGGLVIAAHANSSNGVAMRGFTFGGQTQDRLYPGPKPARPGSNRPGAERDAGATAGFFSGTKAGIPAADALHPGFGCSSRDNRPSKRKKEPRRRRSGDRCPSCLM